MRNALVAETMPPDRFMAAVGAARTTSDSARVVGSLAGAGLFAALGMGPRVCGDHLLLLGRLPVDARRGRRARGAHADGRHRAVSMWRDLREGLAYVWDTPCSLAAMWLAFLVNMTAFPLTSGLLPYVAREIYHVDQTGLGSLVASFAIGALLGSIAISVAGRLIRPARMMIVFALAWYAMLLVFVRMPTVAGGGAMLVLRRICAEPEHGADGGHAAAQRRAAFPRPGDGGAHVGDLRPAAGAAGGRGADRAHRLRRDGDVYCASGWR